MREAASLKASTAAAPKDLLTHAEKSEYQETGTYAECVGFYEQLVKRSPYAKLVTIGKTGEGRPLYVLIVSKDKAFTPEAAAKTGKPVAFLQNGIHAGENGGKDAAMMLLRDVLVTKKLAGWLDKMVILSIPVFNADGHEHVWPYNRINENGPKEMGFRVTAQRLNLNRDYMKADTPEMRAWLKLYTAWLPDFLVDNHVTDGSDNQYDVTIATHTEQDIAPPVGQWVSGYVKKMLADMNQLGHVAGWYGDGRAREGAAVPIPQYTPRYSTGYAAAQNRAALLVETHSLKSFKTRVWSHYDIMKTSLDYIASDPGALKKASAAADEVMAAVKPGDKVFLEGTPGGEGEPYTVRMLEFETYQGTAAGGPVRRYTAKPLDQNVRIVRTLKEKVAPTAPLGYIVPRQWTEVIELLKVHGIKVEPLAKGLSGTFETYRFENARFAPMPFEGRFQVASFQLKASNEDHKIPAESVFIPVAQRAGKLAMQLLEPEAPDSVVRWGFFQPVFEQKEYFSDYVFEPFAEKMLAEDPALKAEFEAQKLTDSRARLLWLFKRSPYYEGDKDAYPVVRVTAKTW